jgi:trigger factor
VTLKQYKELSVQAEEILPDLTQVDQTLERYQSNLATLVPVEDRPAEMGDVAVIDFVGKVQDEAGEWEAFEGGSAEDFQVELSEGRFIPGFIEGIAGMALEETKDLEISFPDDYSQPDLAGKPALFSITLKEIKEKELPDLDDDFAQEVSEYETIAELRASLEKRYTEEAENRTKTNKNEALIAALVEHLEAEIPNTLIQREVDFLLTQTIMQFSRQGIDVNKLLTRDIVDNMRKQTRPDAVARLNRTLALGEVAKQEGIAVEKDALEAKVEEVMADIEDINQMDPDRLVQVIEEELLQEKILTWLEGVNTVELVPEGSLKKADDAAEADETVDAESAVVEVEATTAE